MESWNILVSSFSDLVSPFFRFIIWAWPIKIYKIDNGERGVVKTYGKVRDWRGSTREAGVVICFMFEEMEVVQADGCYVDLDEQTLTTKDNRVVVINGGVEYTILNVKQAILETDDIEVLLVGFCMDRIRQHGRTKVLEELLDSDKLTRDISGTGKIKTHGVRIDKIMITDLRPHEVTLACDTLKDLYGRWSGVK